MGKYIVISRPNTTAIPVLLSSEYLVGMLRPLTFSARCRPNMLAKTAVSRLSFVDGLHCAVRGRWASWRSCASNQNARRNERHAGFKVSGGPLHEPKIDRFFDHLEIQ